MVAFETFSWSNKWKWFENPKEKIWFTENCPKRWRKTFIRMLEMQSTTYYATLKVET